LIARFLVDRNGHWPLQVVPNDIKLHNPSEVQPEQKGVESKPTVLMRKLLKKHGFTPEMQVTDELRSYSARSSDFPALRRKRSRAASRWQLDEMAVMIGGKQSG
jgi:hypothetical protein